MPRPINTIIDAELCTGCGECTRVCPTEALTMVGDKAEVTGDESIGCGHCAAVCPSEAITVAFIDDRALELATIRETASHLPPGEFDTGSLVQLMRSRRSCRNYTDRPVERDLLSDLVKIGTTAPSGTNSQLWTFTILGTRNEVLELAGMVGSFYTVLNRKAANPAYRLLARIFAGDVLGRYYRGYHDTVKEGLRRWREEGRDLLFHGAPAAILVGGDPEASCPAEDALLATQNIVLAAHAMGLGSCLIGFVVEAIKREPGIKRAIGIPDREKIYAAIALGWPDETYFRPSGRRRVEPRWVSVSSVDTRP